MKPLSALVFVLGISIGVDAGFVGLRDAFFGTGPYANAPLNRRAGGIENPQRCVGISNDKRFQPHQPSECRILEQKNGKEFTPGAWNYCPADPNANCQIPMACVDEDLCKDNKCGVFGNKDFTTISCSDSFHCGHTAIIDPAQRNLDATRWVCNKTPGFAMTIEGKMSINEVDYARTFDGKGAKAVVATTFDPYKSSNSETSSTESSSSSSTSASDSSTITAGPSVSVTTTTVIPEPTSDTATGEPKTNMAPIIGGAVGGVAALALLGLAFFLWRHHKRNSVNTFTAIPFVNSSSSSEKGPDGNGQRTPLSQWMPTPASTQGTWTPNDPTAGGPNGTYSGTVSEMPTPDLLGRDWNHNPQGAVEMGTPTPTVKAWGGGQTEAPMAQNWNGPVDPHIFDPYGAPQQHPAVAPGGLPVSLTPGRKDTERAELA